MYSRRHLDRILHDVNAAPASPAERVWGPTAPEALEAEARPDCNLNQYVLVSEVGHGGMATVWKAWDRALQRWVAVKVLHPDSRLEERFLRELRCAGKLRHENVVTLYEAGDREGCPFLVMEFVEGGTLAQQLASGRPLRTLVEILEKVARGVHHAHENGIIHRDLKPANILIADGSQPKVADFGLARVAGSEHSLTRTGAILGTPHYMAPEQLKGTRVEVDRRIDVYALGVILYQVLTGRVPFIADTWHALSRKILDEEAADPAKVRPGVPGALAAVALRALEKEPARRYASACDFADDLRRWLAGSGVLARRPSAMERARSRRALVHGPGHGSRARRSSLADGAARSRTCGTLRDRQRHRQVGTPGIPRRRDVEQREKGGVGCGGVRDA
jgi:serine/threonine protein kinase